jgi:hypothetical protein
VGVGVGVGVGIGDIGDIGDIGVGLKQILSETQIFKLAVPITPTFSHTAYPVSVLNF